MCMCQIDDHDTDCPYFVRDEAKEREIAIAWLDEVKGIGLWSIRELLAVRRLMRSEYERGYKDRANDHCDI
jgi:hypothetical protein